MLDYSLVDGAGCRDALSIRSGGALHHLPPDTGEDQSALHLSLAPAFNRTARCALDGDA
jgi:hypothetical protein